MKRWVEMFKKTGTMDMDCGNMTSYTGFSSATARLVEGGAIGRTASFHDTFNAVKLDPNAKIPSKANPQDAGFDIYALDGGCIAPKMRLMIPTGIAVAIPRGWYGRVAPRSGLAHNYGLDVLAGVVDSTYRGELKVILINHGSGDFKFEAGDRIAQLVLERCGEWDIKEVASLDETTRGVGGFGSTGK